MEKKNYKTYGWDDFNIKVPIINRKTLAIVVFANTLQLVFVLNTVIVFLLVFRYNKYILLFIGILNIIFLISLYFCKEEVSEKWYKELHKIK